MTRIANTFTRNLASMFPAWFTNQRHDFERDYGWPDEVTFGLLFKAAHRTGIARAAVEKTSLRVWKSMPEIWESEEPTWSTSETAIRQHLEDIRFWQACIEADRRAYVGGYAGLVLRFADSKPFAAPVERVAGIVGLVEAEPVWAGQLSVKTWNEDETSQDYGKPKMFELREDNKAFCRSYPVHPHRVIIWSRDGTVYSRSELEAGYNDLLDIEKIKGAGGEGFWKNAKAMPVIEVNPDTSPEDMARMMGVPVDKVKPALDDEVNDWLLGFNKMLMLMGMKAVPINIQLPRPKEFVDTPIQSFAASVTIPTRILLGNDTGERASTQDQEDFNHVCMARRERYIVPTLRGMLNRFEKFGLIPKRDYTIGWESLFDASPDEKMARADKMADINQKAAAEGGRVFEDAEIREEAGFEALVVSAEQDDTKIDNTGDALDV